MTTSVLGGSLSMAALDYLRSGHHILALRGKRPHSHYHPEWSWDNSFHGVPGDDDMERFEAVWADRTVTGIAILIPPHVLVADIDSEDAAALFSELAGMPEMTAIGRTTHGLHVWYLAPGQTRTRWLGGRTLLFKGFGGYVAVEPSKHFADEACTRQDGRYEWIADLEGGVDFLPVSIQQMFESQDKMDQYQVKPDDDDMVAFAIDGWNWWPVYAMEGLQRVIREAADGNQNNVIHWAACVARDAGVPLEATMTALLAAAREGHHPEIRARASIRSAYKRGERG